MHVIEKRILYNTNFPSSILGHRINFKVIFDDSDSFARYINIKKDQSDLFSKLQLEIQKKFSDLPLTSNELQIYWKDEDNDEIAVEDTDDLLAAMESPISRSICKLYFRPPKDLSSGKQK